jgi:phosphopantetheinyl transferase (holo-ACP synthase)
VTARAVGNDVVDLADPAIARHHEDTRFVARVCGDDERARVTTARALWTLFAAKEAAYKALMKLGESPGFGHRAIRVAPELDVVSWGKQRLRLTVTGDSEHVHAVAWTDASRTPVARAGRLQAGEGESEGARRVLRALAAEALGCNPDALAVLRDPAPGAWDGFSPPRLERSGERVDADVSLSHDGRFVAAAALLDVALAASRHTPR